MKMFESKSLILTVILTNKLSLHPGSFSKSMVISYMQKLDDSPMFCDTRVTQNNTEMVVITDVKNFQQQSIQSNRLVIITAHISALIFSIFLLLLSFFMIKATNSFIGSVIVICSWLLFLLLMNISFKKNNITRL